jgi:hypothetical protein
VGRAAFPGQTAQIGVRAGGRGRRLCRSDQPQRAAVPGRVAASSTRLSFSPAATGASHTVAVRGRSAGLQPAVSPNCIRPGVGHARRTGAFTRCGLQIRDTAECNSALRRLPRTAAVSQRPAAARGRARSGCSFLHTSLVATRCDWCFAHSRRPLEGRSDYWCERPRWSGRPTAHPRPRVKRKTAAWTSGRFSHSGTLARTTA